MSFLSNIENFFSTAATQVEKIGEAVVGDLTAAEKWVQNEAELVVSAAPQLVSGVETILEAFQSGGTNVVADVEAVLTAGNAIISQLYRLVENSTNPNNTTSQG